MRKLVMSMTILLFTAIMMRPEALLAKEIPSFLEKEVTKTTTQADASTTQAGKTTQSDEMMTQQGVVTTQGNETMKTEVPASPTVTEIQGGNKRAKLYWNEVEKAEGYKIYMSSNSGASYEMIAEIRNPKQTMYTKINLSQKTTYFFYVTSYIKTPDGSKEESPASVVVTATTSPAAATSKTAVKYKTKSSFFSSAAYKKYYAFADSLKYSKSFALPGLKNTNVGGFANTNMVPQGICFAGAYTLITAYDKTGKDESVVYVLSKSSKAYITTLVLPDKAPVGGIAYDGDNLWLTGTNCVMSLPYAEVVAAVSSGSSFLVVSQYATQMPLSMPTSFLAYYNNILWVGGYNATSATPAYGYITSGTGSSAALTQMYTMTMPSRTKSIAITDSGVMYLTRSCQSDSSKSGYLSQIRTFQPSFTMPSANGTIGKNKMLNKMTLPPLCEGVAVGGSYAYVVFSSYKYSDCNYPVDRAIAFSLAKLN